MAWDWGQGDALAGYTWDVQIEGHEIAQFKEISGISAEIQTIEHRENKIGGGPPVIRQLPGARKWGPLTLKRGRTDNQELWSWMKDAQDGNMSAARKDGTITLYDYAHAPVMKFHFTRGWPSKISLGSLNAGGNDILLEEVTITHEGIYPDGSPPPN